MVAIKWAGLIAAGLALAACAATPAHQSPEGARPALPAPVASPLPASEPAQAPGQQLPAAHATPPGNTNRFGDFGDLGPRQGSACAPLPQSSKVFCPVSKGP